MAIYNGRILMRKGNEADFDAEKLMAGEWAVSLDKGIVRICLQAGKVIRMATYEAFEQDMRQIEAILLECQSIEEAVRRINTEINAKVDAVVEYVGQAKTYRDEALQFRNEAEAFKNQAGEIAGIGIATNEKAGIVKPDGVTTEVLEDGTMRVIGGGGVSDYSELDNKPSINGTELDGEMSLENLGIASATELEKTNTKVDTIIEKADLCIKETASGEEIHLTDSAEGKAVEYALYGKARQNTTTGKNLLDKENLVVGLIDTNGNEIEQYAGRRSDFIELRENILTYSNDNPSDTNNTTFALYDKNKNFIKRIVSSPTPIVGVPFTFTFNVDDAKYVRYSVAYENIVNSNIQLEYGSIATPWEKYTGGIASPNPDYPQEIEVSGESYNLLENTAESKTINGVEFVVNEDKSVEVVGVSTSSYINFDVGTLNVKAGESYTFSGIDGGSESSYRLYIMTNAKTFGNDFAMYSGEVTKTATVDDVATVRFQVIPSGYNSDTIIYPMIRKATVKNDRYMPYGVGSVEVRSVGKNLYDVHDKRIESYISDATIDEEGYINATVDNSSGTSHKYANFWTNPSTNIQTNKQYKLICDNQSSGCDLYVLSNHTVHQSQFTKASLIATSGITNNTILSKTNFDDCVTMLRTYIQVPAGSIAKVRFRIMIVEEDVEDLSYEPYKETLSTIPTPNELAGIKVSSGGNYTDQNGQQWICDEVVKYADGSGAYIQRIEKLVLDGLTNAVSNFWESQTNYNKNMGVRNLPNADVNNVLAVISDCFTSKAINSTVDESGIKVDMRGDGSKSVFLKWLDSYGLNTGALQNAWLQENNVTVYYVLAEPITTPLTSEELAEISTFYPVTNISNDFDCGMRIEYVGDSIITTNTEIPLVEPKDEEELESGDNIVTLFGKIKKKLKSVGKGVIDVVDNLLSTSTDLPLSANQGRVLDGKISAINDSFESISSVKKCVLNTKIYDGGFIKDVIPNDTLVIGATCNIAGCYVKVVQSGTGDSFMPQVLQHNETPLGKDTSVTVTYYYLDAN